MERPVKAAPETVPEWRRAAGQVRSIEPELARGDRPQSGADQAIVSYFWSIVESWRLMLAFTVGAMVLAALFLFIAKPAYLARSTLQVEQRNMTLAGLEALTSALGEDDGEGQLQIIQSRMLLGGVCDQLNLAVEARPNEFPVIGHAFTRLYKGRTPAPAPFGFTSYAWGGERIAVDRLNVSDDLVNQELRLTALHGGRYSITDEDGQTLVEGVVGSPAKAPGVDGARAIDVAVSTLVARPGTEFVLVKRNREHVIDALQQSLRVQQRGRRSGIIMIELEGEDPARVAGIVNAVSATYLRQNVERKSEEAGKTLEFIESQIPKVKADLDRAERALNAFRLSTGTVSSNDETRAMLEREREYDRQISELELRRSQLRQSFTENHPNLVAVANQLAQLRSERASHASKMKLLPTTEVNSARLQREVNDTTNMYVGLLNKAQELRVVKSGTIGDVHIIDQAHVPDRPSRPHRGLVLMVSLMLGIAGGIAAVLVRRSLARCADTADEVEAATGLPVYVTVPHSDAQEALSSQKRRHRSDRLPFLSGAEPGDSAIETIRSLRTSLQFALVEAQSNIVVLSGPAPGVGKSFVSLNLASVLAAAGRKVLLIDCDLRRGGLHRYFGIDRRPGLSDVVSGAVALDQAVRSDETGSLHILPTGSIPPNPAELLASQRFEALLREASSRYDLVIADTPPLLAVADGVLVAKFAGVNFLVLRAGAHTAREIALAVKQFSLNGIKLHGSVLNDVQPTLGGRYGREGNIRYDYRSEPSN